MRSSALLVGLGIFLSRISGLVREKIFAHYFGNSFYADVFRVALRIPNFLQNLLGEGALSASMIPVYSKLLAEKREAEAETLVRTVGTWLISLSFGLCSLGILIAPWLTTLIAPGFPPEKAALTTQLVRIFFPGIGLLVMSAWCLGILNSHHRFFLSYVAPVLWNASIIVALLIFGSHNSQEVLIVQVSWALLIGCFLQLLVQLPSTFSFLKSKAPIWKRPSSDALLVFKNFIPVVFSRGVVQVSSWIDSMLASRLIEGSVSTLAYAQTLYLLPVSLFGISISASELPAMSRTLGSEKEIGEKLQARLQSSLKRLNFFVLPVSIVFIVLGNSVVTLVFQGGAFGSENVKEVWLCLAASSLGLVATTESRLYASSFYALKNTQSPLRFSIFRVITSTLAAVFFAFYAPGLFHYDSQFATAGLALGFSVAGWCEWLGLRYALGKKIGSVPLISKQRLIYLSVSVALAISLRWIAPYLKTSSAPLDALIVLALFALLHASVLLALRDEIAQSIFQKLKRRLSIF